MATTSYSNLFGTNGSGYGSGGSKPGISTLFGQQEKPKRRQDDGSVMAPAPTFAQLQSQGQARPAPQAAQPEMTQPVSSFQPSAVESAMPSPYSAPVATPVSAPYGAPSVQQPSAGGDFLSRVRASLGSEGNVPGSRYDLPLFQQLRDFQRTQLESEFGAARKSLEDEMASRGLASSSIASGRYGDLAGQQARAMAGIDLGLLQKAADTAAEDKRARDAMRIQLAQLLSQVDPKNLGKMQQQLASLGLFDSGTDQRRP